MKRLLVRSGALLCVLGFAAGCKKPQADAGAAGGMQAFPVQTQDVKLAPVNDSSDYVATIKSRRSVTVMPQVEGNLTQILVKSGDHVRAGQVMLVIDPEKQQALVDAQRSTENQKKALYDYNQISIKRQRDLFDAGVTSRDTLDQAEQSFANTREDWQSAVGTRKSLEQQLEYYRIKAPFDGIVGDVPVHVGDYVSTTTMLTTVDENKDLEAYIYIPTERAAQVRTGLGVDVNDNSGKLIEHTVIDFVSPQVDDQLQGILAKASMHSALVRTEELVKAKVIWSTSPTPVVPVLAVTRLAGQTFVYVAEDQGGKYFAKQREITVGDTVDNGYAVLNGLKSGDKVIVSGIQFLVDGVPVMPLPPGPPAAPPPGAGN